MKIAVIGANGQLGNGSCVKSTFHGAYIVVVESCRYRNYKY